MLYSQHFTFHWKLLVFCQNSPKLTSTIHPIRCAVALGTSTCCQLKVVLPSKRKGLFTAHSLSVSALARLAFYLLILKETSACSRRGWGEGGTSGNSWCGCTAQFSKSLTYFRSKKCNFSHTFSDLASKIYTCLQTWPLRNYVTDT